MFNGKIRGRRKRELTVKGRFSKQTRVHNHKGIKENTLDHESKRGKRENITSNEKKTGDQVKYLSGIGTSGWIKCKRSVKAAAILRAKKRA